MRVLAAVAVALLSTWPPLRPLCAQELSAPLRYVDGRPMLLVTLRAGERTYPCHLLVDLSARIPLLLHANAAGALRAEQVDIEAGDVRLTSVPLRGQRDRALERLTARYAEELKEVPVAGYLGLAAFGDQTVVVDGRGAALRISPATELEPEAAPARALATLQVDPRKGGAQVELGLGEGRTGRFALHTRDPYSFVLPDFAAELGAPSGRLRRATLEGIDFAAYGPFRPARAEGGIQGGIGGRVLQRTTLTFHLARSRLVLEADPPGPYPEDEAGLYAALVAEDPVPALMGWLRDETCARSPFREEAAAMLLERALRDRDGLIDLEAATLGAHELVAATPEKGRASRAVQILESLPERPDLLDLRRELIRKALPAARHDLDGNAQHLLRLQLGQLELDRGDLVEARRQLLGAVFGMPADGRAHLAMGRLHEKLNEPERALSRYFLAVLDPQKTGVDGLLAFTDLYRRRNGGEQGLLAALQELAEGRVPALHPVPRPPQDIRPSGRVVLAEIFTGAECRPCAAADVAFDALDEHFGDDELVVVQWHLPVPAPEPLISAAAQARAQRKGVRGTPTVFFNGTTSVRGGGDPDQATELFGRYTQAIAPLLRLAPTVRIAARARWQGERLEVEAELQGVAAGQRLHAVVVEETLVFPGSNKILFHHSVARGALTPGRGAELQDGQARYQGQTTLTALAAELDRAVAEVETRGRFPIRPTQPARERLAVVLFVEDEASGEVLQAQRVPLGQAREDGR